METIRHIAFALCLSSILAGSLKMLLPENGNRSVINSVLVLYIVSCLLSGWETADFSAFDRLFIQDARMVTQQDYSGYAAQLYDSALSTELEHDLQMQGIAARVTVLGDTATVQAATAQESDRACAFLQNSQPTLTVQSAEVP